jgi:hypothetical protein
MPLNISIPNTTIALNNAGNSYNITPNEGYVMHDSSYDAIIEEEVINEETGDIEIIETGVILGYRRTTASVGARTYDFTPHEMLDEAGNTVTAYGRRNFYTKLESDVPENQIFGVPDKEHEIM